MSDKDDIKKLQGDISKIEQMQDFILDGLIRVRTNEDYYQRYLTKISVWSNEMDEAFSALEAGLVDIENAHRPLSATLTYEDKAKYKLRRKSHIIKLRLQPNSQDEFKKRWDKLAINEMESRAKEKQGIISKHDKYKAAVDPIRKHLDAVFANKINYDWPNQDEHNGDVPDFEDHNDER